eukprot:15589229-Heterocapsa_arctica.AAC.1
MKTDHPPLAIHKAMIIIPGILQRELTNKEEPNKSSKHDNGIGKHPKPSSPLSRAPLQFMSHDGLTIDQPGSKEALELLSVIKEEGSHIRVERDH